MEAVLETRSLLLHDFAHYAVEATLGTTAGFYGLPRTVTSSARA